MRAVAILVFEHQAVNFGRKSVYSLFNTNTHAGGAGREGSSAAVLRSRQGLIFVGAGFRACHHGCLVTQNYVIAGAKVSEIPDILTLSPGFRILRTHRIEHR
ncbi:hypothetical protein U27_01315 [Candidatus Vecturithrix granuli]|uniref:Uncharacterized protein n=1 Tax=Vecturithrix granuli TaxID=1499967 RepID=A0A081CA10_VECG1|nr:hypothetical protein U27_01315 [Candidatus Vecturithrix granuli]